MIIDLLFYLLIALLVGYLLYRVVRAGVRDGVLAAHKQERDEAVQR